MVSLGKVTAPKPVNLPSQKWVSGRGSPALCMGTVVLKPLVKSVVKAYAECATVKQLYATQLSVFQAGRRTTATIPLSAWYPSKLPTAAVGACYQLGYLCTYSQVAFCPAPGFFHSRHSQLAFSWVSLLRAVP